MILQIDITWPATLPLPFVDYSGQPDNSTIASPPESGVISRRSRFERTYLSIAVNWKFTPLQYETFKSFFAEDLGNGTAAFKIELRYPLNSVLLEWIVRFSEDYKAAHEDGTWTVQAAIDVVNPVNF
jgi:hypothetical protein